jgi:hypothetical protein
VPSARHRTQQVAAEPARTPFFKIRDNPWNPWHSFFCGLAGLEKSENAADSTDYHESHRCTLLSW